MKNLSTVVPSIPIPVVTIINNQAITNSKDVANVFEKEHLHVLRDIKNLEIPEDFRKSNFGLTSTDTPMPNGGIRKDKAYAITRDGFTILAMGFTGAKAMKFKLAYIEAFNKMEEDLTRQATGSLLPAVPLKFCVKCEHEKPVTEFWMNKTERDGLQPWCKACFRKADPVVKGDLSVKAQIYFKDLMVQMKDEIVKELSPKLTVQAAAGRPIQKRLEDFTHWPPVPVPTENGTPVTDFGTFSERPWKTAQKLHPELYAKLEAKYAELGKDKHRGVEALRNSMFYETEEFGTLMDYMVHKAPRFLENILKLQLAALGHGVIMEEVGKLSDLRRFPTLNFTEKKK